MARKFMRSGWGARTTAALMFFTAAWTATGALVARTQQPVPEQPDKYTWLEDINGERPMAWVKAEECAHRRGD